MVFLQLALPVALTAALPALFARRLAAFAWIFVIQLIGWTAYGWFFPFQSVGPFGGGALWIGMGVALLVTVVLCGLTYMVTDGESRAARVIVWYAAIGACVTLAIAVTGLFVTTGSALHSSEYRALAAEGIEEGAWGEDVSPVDPAHLRQVSYAQAVWRGNKALSQVEAGAIGSRFKIGEYHIQKVGTELTWVAPLEYQAFSVWSNAGSTPGFVMVSAEDPNREPQLVSGRKLRYIESAFLGDNLWRHVISSGYAFRGLTDPTFEVDDEGNPFYVYTRFEYAVGYNGANPVGALVVDPETGDMTEYALVDLPAWIDRIMPESEAYARLTWYGEYVNGWVNSWWGERDVVVPTDSDLSLVWTDDGRACWFTGMTSTKSTDHALVSIVLMDSRTGQVREYRVDGAADEEDVTGAVQSAVSNYKDWVPTPPIPENVYGRLAWIVPVVNTTGVPQRIAIVSADASKVALGETVKQALGEYRRRMSETGERVVAEDSSTEATVQAVVDRFAADTRGGTTTYLFTVANDARVFSGTSDVSAELPLTRVGDEVTVGFLETEETVVPVGRFNNLSFATRVSPAQERASVIAAEQPLASPPQ